MANDKIKQNYKDIANAIRSKTGEDGLITAEEMPAKIESISTGIEPSGTISITANANDIDVSTYASANVNVPNPSTGTLNIYSNANYDVKNYANVNVNVSNNYVGSADYEFVVNLFNGIDPNNNDQVAFYTPYDTYDLSLYTIRYNDTLAWQHAPQVSDIPGYHSSINGESDIVVLGCLGFNGWDVPPNDDTSWSLTVDIEYREYDGSYTDEELANMWESLPNNTTIHVYDLSGNSIGYIDSISATVSTNSES